MRDWRADGLREAWEDNAQQWLGLRRKMHWQLWAKSYASNFQGSQVQEEGPWRHMARNHWKQSREEVLETVQVLEPRGSHKALCHAGQQ